MIDHNLVTIWFGIEWAERDHDDPSLLVNIANKCKDKYFLFTVIKYSHI
jgi:hypothetical protein